jgi:Sulfotransferase family
LRESNELNHIINSDNSNKKTPKSSLSSSSSSSLSFVDDGQSEGERWLRDEEARSIERQGLYFAHFSKCGGTTLKMVLKQYLAAHNGTWCSNKRDAVHERYPQANEMCGSHARFDSVSPPSAGTVRAQSMKPGADVAERRRRQRAAARLAAAPALDDDDDDDGSMELTSLAAPNHASTHRSYSTAIMVRDPLDRVLSEYAWFFKYKGHRGAPSGTDDPYFGFRDADKQTRTAILAELHDDLARQFKQATSDSLCKFLGFPRNELDEHRACTARDYHRARRRLLEYDLVMLTEAFDDGVVLLFHYFSLRDANRLVDDLSYVKHKVVKRKVDRHDLPKRTVDMIAHNLDYDYRLYALAKQLFRQKFELVREHHAPYFNIDLEAFRAAQSINADQCEQDPTAYFQTCLE